MKLLVVTPYYAPDLGPSAPMFTLLCEELVRLGHEVTVLCAVPHFPTGHVPAKYRKGLWRWSVENGVQICRVRVPSGDRANLFQRLWVFAVYQALAALSGLRLRYDAALVTNPAIETILPFVVLCWLRRKPCIYAVWDVYPQAGVRMGVFRQRIVIWMVGLLEDFCLRNAACIQVLSEGMRADLDAHKANPVRIAVIPHWLDTAHIRPLPRSNSFSKQSGLDEYFVVLYAGNLGLSQGLETILEAARLLHEQKDVIFVFAGDGAAKLELEKKAAGLGNVRFLPYQPHERLPELLATADISLVMMKKGMGSASLPSKLFSILASGRPVLASVDAGSDVVKVVCDPQAGLCVEPETPRQLAEAILALRDDPLRRGEMGHNGRRWVEKHHSLQSAAQQFERLFLKITGN